MTFERIGERLGGELGTLVGVEDFRGSKALYSLFQGLDAEIRIQSVLICSLSSAEADVRFSASDLVEP